MRRFKSILVVDDDADVRESIAEVLSSEGHPSIVAADGAEALAALEGCETPTLVLLDARMPGMDGSEFLERLRSKSVDDIRVIVISASPIPRADSSLVIGELPKPFEVDALLALLTSA
jgi:two-component system nitrogen regulation response regulator NtrX